MTIYTNPAKYGVRCVGEIDWSETPYQFDLTVAWVDNAGRYYWGDDDGCSCPMPYESITALSQLQTGTLQDLIQSLRVNATRRKKVRTDAITRLATRLEGR